MIRPSHRDSAAGQNPRLGVGVLILNEQRQVLLTLRKLPPEAGCWSIVGGKLPPNLTMTARDAIRAYQARCRRLNSPRSA